MVVNFHRREHGVHALAVPNDPVRSGEPTGDDALVHGDRQVVIVEADPSVPLLPRTSTGAVGVLMY